MSRFEVAKEGSGSIGHSHLGSVGVWKVAKYQVQQRVWMGMSRVPHPYPLLVPCRLQVGVCYCPVFVEDSRMVDFTGTRALVQKWSGIESTMKR